MTEVLQKELSRKTFLKGGGALIVGFSLAGAAVSGKAKAAPLDTGRIDAWLAIHADNTASIRTGKVELGQGSSTGLLQVAGEELSMTMSQLRWINGDTGVTPNTGWTSASLSIRQASPQLRAAAVEARKVLLNLASQQLVVPVASLTVNAGVVSGGGRSVTYGELLGDKPFNVSLPAAYNMTATSSLVFPNAASRVGLLPGDPGTRPVSQYTLVGTRAPRIDIPDKVTGKYTYVHNIQVPGMLHGRIVRPRGQGAFGSGERIVSVDASSIKRIAGARIVRKNNFIGVVAPTEFAAIQAAAQLKVTWADPPPISSSGNLWKQMRADDAAGKAPATMPLNRGNVADALKSATHVVSGSFGYHYNTHGSLGPSCCIADVKSSSAVILSNTEGVFVLRTLVAQAIGLPEESIRVQYREGASPYGDDAPYNDAGVAAAIMSQIVGKPVRLQFMRWDEHGWDSYAPAQLTEIRAGIDASGKLVAFDSTIFGVPYILNTIDTAAGAHAGQSLSIRPTANAGDGSRAVEAYTVPNARITLKSLPLKDNYFSSGYMRAPGSPQGPFASEQVMDDLARAANMDPVAFRVLNLTAADAMTRSRWLGVIDGATKAAGWTPKVPASGVSSGNVVTGRGFAMHGRGSGTYGSPQLPLGAAVADVEVDRKTGKIVVKHVFVALDAGMVVNPGLVESQIVGGTTQTVSRGLFEQVRFNRKRVTGLDWVSYPILRFADAPTVTPVVIQRLDMPPLGVGQEMVQAVVPAIANAFFDATGVRLREGPMTPAIVRAALAAKGAGTLGVK